MNVYLIVIASLIKLFCAQIYSLRNLVKNIANRNSESYWPKIQNSQYDNLELITKIYFQKKMMIY